MPRPFVVLLAALAMPAVAPAQGDATTAPDPIAQLVARLDLERYKATIKGLTNFGDRRQGTDRNRAAVDWIEAQLRSYGCSNVTRLKYDYQPPSSPSPGGRGGQGVRPAAGGGRYRGARAQTGVNTDSLKQPEARLRALDAQARAPHASGHERPAQVARHDPARHDALRPRHAARRRHARRRAAAGSGCEHRVPGEREVRGRGRAACVDVRAGQREVCDRLPGVRRL